MYRTHGYSPKGKRCHGIEDWHPSKGTNVIGALIDKSFLTVSLFESNINTTIFNSRVEQDLIPKLPPNSVVTLDNTAFHKSPKLTSVSYKKVIILEVVIEI